MTLIPSLEQCPVTYPPFIWGWRIGAELRLSGDLSALCCNVVVSAGSGIRVRSHPSKGRTIVQVLSCDQDSRLVGTQHEVLGDNISADAVYA